MVDSPPAAPPPAAPAKPAAAPPLPPKPAPAAAAAPQNSPPAAAGPSKPAPAGAPTPASPAAAAPKPAAKVAPPPTGDYAVVAAALNGTSFQVLEDGVGVLTVAAEDLMEAASHVQKLGYTLLSLLDGYDRVDHFGVLYAFLKPVATPQEFGELRLRVVMPKKDASGAVVEPICPSLVPLVP
ncbi:MAG: hypothetical protein ACYDBQ_06725, partial [Thermoplasmatota archaeon]